MGRGRIAWALAAALVLIVGVLAWREFAHERQLAELRRAKAADDARLAKQDATVASLAASVITPEVIAKAKASLYLVLANGAPDATAWMVDRKRGIVATNNHVAQHFGEGMKLSVANRETTVPIRIIGVEDHKAYAALEAAMKAYAPTKPPLAGGPPPAAHLDVRPFDVALMQLDMNAVEAQHIVLGPDLPIASQADLEGLKAGDPIALLGYPSAEATDTLRDQVPDVRTDTGVISALSNYFPVPDDRDDARGRWLVVHRMLTAPGNSGSPIINAKGEAIAIESAHIVSASPDQFGERIAHRADLVRDLLGQFDTDRRIDELYRPEWEWRLGHFAPASEAIPAYLRARLSRPDNGASYVVTRHFGDFLWEYDWAFPPDTDPEDRKTPPASLVVRPMPTIRITGEGYYSEQALAISPDREYVLYAYDYQPEDDPCPITAYYRRESDNVAYKADGTFAQFAVDTPTAQRLDILYKEGITCGTKGGAFMIGVLSWPKHPAPTAKSSFGETLAAGVRGIGFDLARSARLALGQIDHARRCAIPGLRHDPDACRIIDLGGD